MPGLRFVKTNPLEPVITAVNHILSYAFEQRASDIHFGPERNATLVRLHIDGGLHEVHRIPWVVYQAIVSREESRAMGMALEALERRSLKKGRGCLHCRQTGYSGRDGIFKILHPA